MFLLLIIITTYKSKLFVGVLFPWEGDRIPSILTAGLSVIGWKVKTSLKNSSAWIH